MRSEVGVTRTLLRVFCLDLNTEKEGGLSDINYSQMEMGKGCFWEMEDAELGTLRTWSYLLILKSMELEWKLRLERGFRGILRGFRCGMWILGIDLQVTGAYGYFEQEDDASEGVMDRLKRVNQGSRDVSQIPGVQWLRYHTPSAEGPGLIPGQGARSHMLQLRVHTPKLETNKQTNRSCVPVCHS